MFDPNSQAHGCLPVRSPAEALHWNTPEKGWGIFVTVNSFAGARRKENLIRINAWAVDMDNGTKAEMHARIQSCPLIPSLIVETKRGYQVYWDAADAKPEHWNYLVLGSLVPWFGSDKNARDLCRILRAPGFLHLKQPEDPFRCEAVFRRSVHYTERQLHEAFPYRGGGALDAAKRDEHRQERKEYAKATGTITSETFWDAIYNLDCRDGLERLSGTGAVNGETFTFKPCSNGNLNILVDDKGTSCWVDSNGRIGSLSNGGPTLYQWLRWYKMPERECIQALKGLYPHLAEIDAQLQDQWRQEQRAHRNGRGAA